MKNIRTVAMFLCVVLFVTVFAPTSFAANETVFTDVSTSDWFCEYVIDMNEKGIVNGNPDGTFSPNKPVTIGEFCAMMCRAVGADVPDVEEGEHWANEYFYYVKHKGGWQTRLIFDNLDKPMNRREAVEVSMRMFGYRFPVDEKYLEHPFVDIQELSSVPKNYLVNAYYLGIISGNQNNEVNPNSPITKAEACKIIQNVMNCDLSEPIKPDILTRVKTEFKGEHTESFYSDVCFALSYYNNSVIEALAEKAKIVVTAEHQSKYIGNMNIEASGCYLSDNTIVCFTNGASRSLMFGIGSTLKHEIGHFIYEQMLTAEERAMVKASFNSNEKELLKKATHSNYCETNEHEYFAELISVYARQSYVEGSLKDANLSVAPILDKFVN